MKKVMAALRVGKPIKILCFPFSSSLSLLGASFFASQLNLYSLLLLSCFWRKKSRNRMGKKKIYTEVRYFYCTLFSLFITSEKSHQQFFLWKKNDQSIFLFFEFYAKFIYFGETNKQGNGHVLFKIFFRRNTIKTK